MPPFWPEALYQLAARDHQITWLDPVLFHTFTAAAATTVEAKFTVPAGRMLLLQSATVEAVSGAAQTVSYLAVVAIPPVGGVPFVALAGEWTTGAPAKRFVNWSGSVVIAPGWIIDGTADYSAGAAANTTGLAIAGLLIPVGNIQRI